VTLDETQELGYELSDQKVCPFGIHLLSGFHYQPLYIKGYLAFFQRGHDKEQQYLQEEHYAYQFYSRLDQSFRNAY